MKAYYNHGRWVADCPDPQCEGSEIVERGRQFVCGSCHRRDWLNQQQGKPYNNGSDVLFPHEDLSTAVEDVLAVRPLSARNWWDEIDLEVLMAENEEQGLPSLDIQQKGLAYVHANLFPDDPGILGCTWTYNWGLSGNVPMSGKGDITGISPDYDGYLLLFNEPNNPEPYGRDIDPKPAASIYKVVKSALPNAKLVVGGISAWCDVAGFGSAYAWVAPFLVECDALGVKRPGLWHIHGYVEAWITAGHIIEWWGLHRQLTGADYWVTEYGSPDGTADDFIELTEFIKQTSWIKRYAAFTNRVDGSEVWLPPGWAPGVSLLDYANGVPTARGKYYLGV